MNLLAKCQQMSSGVPEFMAKKRSRGHPSLVWLKETQIQMKMATVYLSLINIRLEIQQNCQIVFRRNQ